MIMLSCSSLKIPLPTTSFAEEPYPCVIHLRERATRAGGRSSPSRAGFSPSSSSSRRTSSSNSLSSSLLACVFDIVVFGLPEDEPGQLARLDLWGEDFPEGRHDVFRGWDHVAHERHIEIEVLVVHDVDDFFLHDCFQLGKIAHVPGLFVDVALNGHI